MSLKVTKGQKSRYKGQNRSNFDLNKKRQIIHKNEALNVMSDKMTKKLKLTFSGYILVNKKCAQRGPP